MLGLPLSLITHVVSTLDPCDGSDLRVLAVFGRISRALLNLCRPRLYSWFAIFDRRQSVYQALDGGERSPELEPLVDSFKKIVQDGGATKIYDSNTRTRWLVREAEKTSEWLSGYCDEEDKWLEWSVRDFTDEQSMKCFSTLLEHPHLRPFVKHFEFFGQTTGRATAKAIKTFLAHDGFSLDTLDLQSKKSLSRARCLTLEEFLPTMRNRTRDLRRFEPTKSPTSAFLPSSKLSRRWRSPSTSPSLSSSKAGATGARWMTYC
ncbi:hypothetical protein JCM11641_003632 [Rhodosporidiobolus odoratus]